MSIYVGSSAKIRFRGHRYLLVPIGHALVVVHSYKAGLHNKLQTKLLQRILPKTSPSARLPFVCLSSDPFIRALIDSYFDDV